MPVFTKASDAEQKIQVESHLVYAVWVHKKAHAGQEAAVEVKTTLVGNGAKITITCYTDKGKKLDKIEGVILDNRFSGSVIIPDKIKPGDMVYFEAELPKHRLSGESHSIPVRPAIQVRQLKWDKTSVGRGDTVTMTCQFQDGVADGDEATVIVYEHNPNSCDMKTVTIPTTIKNNKVELLWEFNYQDCTSQIPTEAEMNKYEKKYAAPKYFFMVLVDGVRIGKAQESGLLEFLDVFELDLKNIRGEPLADREYILHFADGTQREGRLDSDGRSTEANLPPGKIRVELPPKKQ